jgi:hypothetical protein
VAEEEGWWEAEDSPEVITASEGWSGDFDEFTSNFDGLLSDMQNEMAELGDGDVAIDEVRALADAQVESRIGSLPFSDSKKRAARRIWRAKADKTQFASDELEADKTQFAITGMPPKPKDSPESIEFQEWTLSDVLLFALAVLGIIAFELIFGDAYF